jgi:hypothetical protein
MSLTMNLRKSEILACFAKCRALEMLKKEIVHNATLVQVRIFMSDDGPRKIETCNEILSLC